MLLTLAWKEIREHQAIWLTMVAMTVGMGLGLAKIASLDNPGNAEGIAEITILGMAAVYGIVCGAMMFAGEHENGTITFLDVFSGRRDLLWTGKFLTGAALVILQALAVGLILRLVNHPPPNFGMSIVGLTPPRGFAANAPPLVVSPNAWYLVLTAVTLEAYAWGLFGSSLTRRVLPAAAVAAMCVAPVWIFTMFTAPLVFLAVRVLAALVMLVNSHLIFFNQARETKFVPPEPEKKRDKRSRYLDAWDRLERTNGSAAGPTSWDHPEAESALPSALVLVPAEEVPSIQLETVANAKNKSGDKAPHSKGMQASQREVLWWLTLQQAWGLVGILACCGFVIGFVIPSGGQVLWALVTLLVGVACGTAAFAPEQRDQSYQFLSAQHFPLHTIWRFKILFWLSAAAMIAGFAGLGAILVILEKTFLRPRAGLGGDFHLGTLPEIMGPALFLGGWLLYGFAAGQIIVWLCRKSILALLLAGMTSIGLLSLWFTSLFTGGMSGWQLWVTPITMIVATRQLMRAWASGRIKERRPAGALVGFAALILAWMAINFAYRAWEVADTGSPLDMADFRATLPTTKDNIAGRAIEGAVNLLDQPGAPWLEKLWDLSQMPTGVIEVPRADGQAPSHLHLASCQKIIANLRHVADAESGSPRVRLEYVKMSLALSRNLRHKATISSYLVGVDAEADALAVVDHWLNREHVPLALLPALLDELNRHADRTPSVRDCLQTECFRSHGVLAVPQMWGFYSSGRGSPGTVPERWLASSIALSMEAPWEAERKERLWRLVWAGLFRGIETPYWQLPEVPPDVPARKHVTQQILRAWLPGADGSGLTRDEVARLMDDSWLADDRIFPIAAPLRAAATRARWRVDAARQAVALALFEAQEGRPAKTLNELVPKYLGALPIDPYSGAEYRYRVSDGERIAFPGELDWRVLRGQMVLPGQGVLWSTGPDRIDHGARFHGGHLGDGDKNWLGGRFDLITLVPSGR